MTASSAPAGAGDREALGSTSTASTPAGATSGEIVAIPIASLGRGQGVRREQIDLDHIERLLIVVADLPPIMVRPNGDRFDLIDGAHRVEAHKRAGESTIRAVVVDLDDTAALMAATEANVTHGRPLDTTDRKNAARRLIEMDPDLSDVVIAKACGLSDKTIADLRPRSTSESPRLNARTGADGRKRPTPEVARQNRRKAEEIVEAEPDIGTRDLSAKAGVSLGTASDVKKRGPVSAAPPASEDVTVAEILIVIPDKWSKERACQRSNDGRDFAQFMDRRSVKFAERAERSDAGTWAEKCPPEMREAAAAAARRQAGFWNELAEELSRTQRRMEVVR